MGITRWRRSHQALLVGIWLTQLPGVTGRAASTPELVGGLLGAAAVAFAVVAVGRAVAARLGSSSSQETSNG